MTPTEQLAEIREWLTEANAYYERKDTGHLYGRPAMAVVREVLTICRAQSKGGLGTALSNAIVYRIHTTLRDAGCLEAKED